MGIFSEMERAKALTSQLDEISKTASGVDKELDRIAKLAMNARDVLQGMMDEDPMKQCYSIHHSTYKTSPEMKDALRNVLHVLNVKEFWITKAQEFSNTVMERYLRMPEIPTVRGYVSFDPDGSEVKTGLDSHVEHLVPKSPVGRRCTVEFIFGIHGDEHPFGFNVYLILMRTEDAFIKKAIEYLDEILIPTEPPVQKPAAVDWEKFEPLPCTMFIPVSLMSLKSLAYCLSMTGPHWDSIHDDVIDNEWKGFWNRILKDIEDRNPGHVLPTEFRIYMLSAMVRTRELIRDGKLPKGGSYMVGTDVNFETAVLNPVNPMPRVLWVIIHNNRQADIYYFEGEVSIHDIK